MVDENVDSKDNLEEKAREVADIRMYHLSSSVDQAGSERTEAGESALPAEESPQPGRAKRKL